MANNTPLFQRKPWKQNFKNKSEKVKTATRKYVDEVKKQNIPLLDIGLTDKPGKGNLSWNVLSYNPAEKEAIAKIKSLTERISTARKKFNKK
tara:strand:+ start:705 stop:980 length:276 start_codon:yes stop_codon:yes gene_type:complete